MKPLFFLSAICIVLLTACLKPKHPACDTTPGANLFIYSVGYTQSEVSHFYVAEYNSTMGSFSSFLKYDTLTNPLDIHNSVDTFLLYQTNIFKDFRVTMPSNGRTFNISAMGNVNGVGSDCEGPVVDSKVDTQTVYGHYLYLVK